MEHGDIKQKIFNAMMYRFNGDLKFVTDWYERPHPFIDEHQPLVGKHRSPREIVEAGEGDKVLKFIDSVTE